VQEEKRLKIIRLSVPLHLPTAAKNPALYVNMNNCTVSHQQFYGQLQAHFTSRLEFKFAIVQQQSYSANHQSSTYLSSGL
jgi:hypothetical protein